MPIYEYACLKCRCKFEWLLRASDERVVCLECGSADIKRLVSAFSFASKGMADVKAGGGSSCSGCSKSSCSGCH